MSGRCEQGSDPGLAARGPPGLQLSPYCSQVYISEIAYPEVRGLLGSCVQLMVVTGILLAYLAGESFHIFSFDPF